MKKKLHRIAYHSAWDIEDVEGILYLASLFFGASYSLSFFSLVTASCQFFQVIRGPFLSPLFCWSCIWENICDLLTLRCRFLKRTEPVLW
jgi:hypothetical protein